MKNHLNYLFVLPTDSIGGAERVAMNLVLHLLHQDNIFVKVVFMCSTSSGSWDEFTKYENCQIINLRQSREIYGVINLSKYFINDNSAYEYIYTTHTHINSFIALLRKFSIIKSRYHVARESTVMFDRFFGWKRILARLLYCFYGNIDLVICQTEYMKRRFLDEVSTVKSSRVLHIANPINLEVINSSIKSDFPLCFFSKTDFNIIQVGRLIDIKNHELTLRSLALLNSTLRYKYFIIGSGPKKNYLANLASELGVSDSVVFVGSVTNPYIYMANSDLGVLSSIKEGFPNVLIEMMASGIKNIITTQCAGDLNELPKVTVFKSLFPQDLAIELEKAILHKFDFSHVYKVYAHKRDVHTFWSNVVEYFDCTK
ncbi:glycosyltransferase [Shewanella xiamenensis]|uniref:glycosyltransferase n=1 Tax=Shewanella xiamenensis TaxID=332186 RepID=UPI0035BAB0A8